MNFHPVNHSNNNTKLALVHHATFNGRVIAVDAIITINNISR